jgi:hypothetical protein
MLVSNLVYFFYHMYGVFLSYGVLSEENGEPLIT